MSVALQESLHEVSVLPSEPEPEFRRESHESRTRSDEIVLLEFADDADQPDKARLRTTFGGLLVSLLLHVWLMMNLGGWLLSSPIEALEPVLETTFAENVIRQEIEDTIPFELANPDDRELEVREVTNAMSLGLAVVQDVPKVAAPAKQLLDEARVELAKLPAYDVPEGLKFDDRLVVKGSTGEQMVQIESALDRVTWEIAQNLQESKVLVVWLVDGSASLKTQREAVAKRLRRIYGELGALDNTSTIPRHDKGLLSSVVMFGEKTNFIVKPTDKFDDIQEGIEKLPTDSSGIENVFTAIKQTVNLWSSYRPRTTIVGFNRFRCV